MATDNYVCRSCTVKDQCSDSCPDYHMTDQDYFYRGLQADLNHPSGREWIYDNYRPGEFRATRIAWCEGGSI